MIVKGSGGCAVRGGARRLRSRHPWLDLDISDPHDLSGHTLRQEGETLCDILVIASAIISCKRLVVTRGVA